jgi:hypothetical protein
MTDLALETELTPIPFSVCLPKTMRDFRSVGIAPRFNSGRGADLISPPG